MKARSGNESQMWVRGISLISIREYVKSRLDREGLERFFASFPEGEPETILAAHKGEWYPFGLQRHLREAVVAEFNPGNPKQAIFDMVAFTADYEISAFLKAMLGYLPINLVLRRTADLWGKYYRPGRIRYIPRGNNAGVFEVAEFPHDPLFCTTMDAWLQAAAKNMGLKNTRVVQTACIHSGDDNCRWEVSWE